MQCSPQVELAVDKICAQGCELVTAYIVALKKDRNRPALLFEPQAIMAAYEETQS